MLIRLRWPDCTLLTPEGTPELAYVLECTADVQALTGAVHGQHLAQDLAWPQCCLVTLMEPHLQG